MAFNMTYMQSNTHKNYQELEKGIWIITGDSDLRFFLLEAEPASILPILSSGAPQARCGTSPRNKAHAINSTWYSLAQSINTLADDIQVPN